MSLTKQLWIAIAMVTLLSLGGSLVVSTLSARQYLQQELAIKNMDNATSLALSLSQLDKDPVTIELQIASQFDAGHYQLIRLVDPTGTLLVERKYAEHNQGSPTWFMRLVPIETRPGLAQVLDGWRQFGTLTVESHSRYAYESLWNATRQLLLWFAGGGLLCGLLGTLVLRYITRPLGSMVEQAEAIGGRRFVTTPEPRTLEFRSVVRAMNTLSERVRTMLADEAQRLEQLRRQTQYDDLTGLFSRQQFLNQLDAALSRNDASAGGLLLITRIANLAELNQRLGRTAADRLLATLASKLSSVAEAHPGRECGRLNASDFALLAAGELDATALGEAVNAAFQTALTADLPHIQLLIAVAGYAEGEARGSLLARIDGGLAAAEHDEQHTLQIVANHTDQPLYSHPDEWRKALTHALQGRAIKLAGFPVLGRQGEVLHREAPVRLQLDGHWCSAGRVLPWAARLGLVARIDALVVEAACARLDRHPEITGLAINLSTDALRDAAFRDQLRRTVQAHPTAASRLWIDIQESSALRHQMEFRDLCLTLRPLGCKLGLKHAGRSFSRFAELHDVGLDYIKISPAFIRGIDQSPSNKAFLRGLCTIAHSIGLLAIAEGVGTPAEVAALPALGIDGMTGPGITAEPAALSEHP